MMWRQLDVQTAVGVLEPTTRLVDPQGAVRPWPVDRWIRPPDAFERQLLDRVRGPAIDLGCGPGRHVAELARRGIPALGVDSDAAAVALARERGATVVQADLFGDLPGEGTWSTALLLDGCIGIGADPDALLRRVTRLVAPDGQALVELDPPGEGAPADRWRIEGEGRCSPWFPWAIVAVDAVHPLARRTGWRVSRLTTGGGRWFATLVR